MNIAVYLGSSPGKDPVFIQEARRLGAWIAASGNTLVYGGSDRGTMGALSEGALSRHGKVIGVMPRFMVQKGWQDDRLDQVILTQDMAERRKKMMDLADAYVAMPGGVGTLDEISEVISASRLSLIQGPVIVLNTHGFYEPLRELLEKMIAAGFYEKESLQKIVFAENTEEVISCLGKERTY